MSYLQNLIDDVNKTHPNLGKLTALSQIVVQSRKMMLIVSPSGCGKSTAMQLIASNTANAIMPDRLSIAGVAVMADRLTGFRSVVVVDDIATTQTDYARTTTVTTLVALVYTHRVESVMAGVEYKIEDFFGSALIGIQPILLRDLMVKPEWDASIQDKVLRYYHLYRPVVPSLELPQVSIKSGISFDTVDDFEPDSDNPDWQKLQTLGNAQWSRARAKEHLRDMLKAIASLENRKQVTDDDYALLVDLLKPMAIENVVVVKEQLEGERYLDNNLLALLAEYYTYNGKFALNYIAQDYKLSISQCYRIMSTQNGNWQQISKSPTIYAPSKHLETILKNYSLEVKNE